MRSVLFSSLSFTVCALIFLLTVVFLIIYRKNGDRKKSKVYYLFIAFTLAVVLLEFAMPFTIKFRDMYPTLNKIISKSYVLFALLWSNLFLYYMYSYKKNGHDTTFYIATLIRIILSVVVCIILPVEFNSTKYYTVTGPLAYILTGGCVLYSFYELSLVLLKKITIKNLLIVPLILGVIAYFGIVIYQFITGDFFCLLSFMYSLVIIDFFYSAENEDDNLLEEYIEQKELSEEINKDKDKFLSSMSKEIRTPMSNIMGLSELIKINADSITLEDVKSNGKEIHTESMHLLDTINNILDLARYEANKEELVNVDYSYEKFILELDDYLHKKDISVSYSFAPNLPNDLNGDISKLKKIILLKIEEEASNYNISKVDIKFSYEGIIEGYLYGLIDVSFIFDGTLDNDLSDGLNLQQSIIDCCCNITKMSVSTEQVSEFKRVFSIKYYNKINNDKELPNMIEVLDKRHKSKELDTKDDYSNCRVLVVDDSQININIVKRLFKKYNFTLDEAISGEKCIELCKTNKYDLILLDDMMPGLSGVETLVELKKLGVESPMIALTANSYDGLKEKYMQDGFSDYLSKPIDADKMDNILTEYLNKGGEDNAL